MTITIKYATIFSLFLVFGAGAGLVIDSFSGYIFGSPFEWEKLPALPEKPASVSKIFLDNIYIMGESGSTFRCALMSEKCWSSDQSLILPDFASTYQYTQESFDNCQTSDLYFSTKSFWKGGIRQCGTSGPWLYGEDLSLTTVVVIDSHENIWVYFNAEATFIDPIENIPPSRLSIIGFTASFGGLLGAITTSIVRRRKKPK